MEEISCAVITCDGMGKEFDEEKGIKEESIDYAPWTMTELPVLLPIHTGTRTHPYISNLTLDPRVFCQGPVCTYNTIVVREMIVMGWLVGRGW